MASQLTVQLCSIVLNEAELLEKNYLQHRGWPGLKRIVLVHCADKMYGQASPEMVTSDGFSVDGTTEILNGIAKEDSRVTVIHHGWMGNTDPAQGKCDGRNRYMEVADEVQPDIFIALDQDEFYTRDDQLRINDLVTTQHPDYRCWRLQQRHIWRPPSVSGTWDGAGESGHGGWPLFSHEVIGGYWAVEHVRIFRYRRGLRYWRNHNWPEARRYMTIRGMWKSPAGRGGVAGSEWPECVHLGFAKRGRERAATNRYYEERGEGRGGESVDRSSYVRCRSSWEGWKPGDTLPHGARVIPYLNGPIPEVFQR